MVFIENSQGIHY